MDFLRLERITCLLLILTAAGLLACGTEGPQAIRYGKDACAHCKMTVSDARFGTQLITRKGRSHNFDDLRCMVAFVGNGEIQESEVKAYYLPDYLDDNVLLPAAEVFLLRSETLKSPMRGDMAAFRTADAREAAKHHFGGDDLNWDDLWK